MGRAMYRTEPRLRPDPGNGEPNRCIHDLATERPETVLAGQVSADAVQEVEVGLAIVTRLRRASPLRASHGAAPVSFVPGAMPAPTEP